MASPAGSRRCAGEGRGPAQDCDPIGTDAQVAKVLRHELTPRFARLTSRTTCCTTGRRSTSGRARRRRLRELSPRGPRAARRARRGGRGPRRRRRPGLRPLPARPRVASLRRAHLRAGRGGHGEGKPAPRGAREDKRGPGAARNPGRGHRGAAVTTWSSPASGRWSPPAAPGGHGNKRFASSTRQAPRFAERGPRGRVGLDRAAAEAARRRRAVGQPNAGKSSLLGRLTRASAEGRRVSVHHPGAGAGDARLRRAPARARRHPRADRGRGGRAGLGHEFLAHVERCRVLVHLVELGGRGSAGRLRDGARRAAALRRRARAAARAGRALEARPGARRRRDGRGGGVARAARATAPRGARGLVGDAAPGSTSCDEAIFDAVAGRAARRRRRRRSRGSRPSTWSTGRPAIRASTWSASEKGVPGPRTRDRVLVRRHDLANPEALGLPRAAAARDRRDRGARSAGFKPGDEVRIGERAFELDPALDEPRRPGVPRLARHDRGRKARVVDRRRRRRRAACGVLDSVCAQVAELHHGGRGRRAGHLGGDRARHAADGAGAAPEHGRRDAGRLGGRPGSAVSRLRGAAAAEASTRRRCC